MAEDKKSFLLYCDSQSLIKQLPDETAGKLLKHIFSFVNDENPQSEDLLLNIAFEHFRMHLKRDLRRYETKKDQWSEAGKKSAEAKKLKKEQEQNSTESTDVENVEKKSTESTVSVSDSVSVTVSVSDSVTDNVILLKKETKESIKGIDVSKAIVKKTNQIEVVEEIIFPFDNENFKVQWKLWKVYKAKEFKFNYKSAQSEQASLMELNNLSNQNEKTAIEIIHQSMAKGWKGFFELKNTSNGTKSNQQVFTDAMESEVGRNFKFK